MDGDEAGRPSRLAGVTRDDELAVGRKRDRHRVSAGAGEFADLLAVLDVPDPDVGLVVRGIGDRERGRRGEIFAVRAERQAADVVGVPLEDELLVTVGEVPELDELIPAAGGERLAVGAEGDREDLHAMAEAEVAENPADVVGKLAGQVRQLPAGLAVEFARLEEPAGGDGGVGLFRHLVGLFDQARQEELGDLLGVVAFGLVDGLKRLDVGGIGEPLPLTKRGDSGKHEDPDSETGSSPEHSGTSERYSMRSIMRIHAKEDDSQRGIEQGVGSSVEFTGSTHESRSPTCLMRPTTLRGTRSPPTLRRRSGRRSSETRISISRGRSSRSLCSNTACCT